MLGELPPMSGIDPLRRQRRCEGEAAERRVRRGIGYVPQEHAIFAKLDGAREPAAGRDATSPTSRASTRCSISFPSWRSGSAQTAATLSGGERKMLAIGRALLGRPKLLMLDEPTEGVWVGVIEEIADRLKQLVA